MNHELNKKYQAQWNERKLKLDFGGKSYEMPFYVHKFQGKSNDGTRSLFIALHGGGGDQVRYRGTGLL